MYLGYNFTKLVFWDLQKQIYASMFDWDIFELGGKRIGSQSLIRQTGSRVHMGAMTQPYAWTRCSPVLQISLQFALHFAQRALSWHTFVCIIKALVPLDTIVLASLKDLSYHKKKKKKNSSTYNYRHAVFPKKRNEKKILKEKGAQIGSMKQNQWEEIVRFCLERVIKPKGLFAWHKGKHRFFLYEWQ